MSIQGAKRDAARAAIISLLATPVDVKDLPQGVLLVVFNTREEVIVERASIEGRRGLSRGCVEKRGVGMGTHQLHPPPLPSLRIPPSTFLYHIFAFRGGGGG